MGIGEPGVRSVVSRFRELMRAEIAETVGELAEVNEGIRALFQALGGEGAGGASRLNHEQPEPVRLLAAEKGTSAPMKSRSQSSNGD